MEHSREKPFFGTGGSAAPAAADRLCSRPPNSPSAKPSFERLRERPKKGFSLLWVIYD